MMLTTDPNELAIQILERVRVRLRQKCLAIYPKCEQDAHNSALDIIDPLLNSLKRTDAAALRAAQERTDAIRCRLDP